MTTQYKFTHADDARRGSAILIVVGTLALIAVFAAIYISIGHSDQRVARSVESREELKEMEDSIADHILDVLARDRFDLTVQHTDRTGTGVYAVRETTDAPYTDWTMRSESANLYERFNPAGGNTAPGLSANLDFRVASDPYLASTTPTYLGDPGLPTMGVDKRPFGSLITNLDPAGYISGAYSSGFLDKRDWLQISNLAPDGRFVNLFNLRPNTAFGNAPIGGFDAEPGNGTFVRDSDGRTIRRMSQYLSLWRPQTGTGDAPDTAARLQAFDPADGGIWLPGRNEPVTDHGLSATDLANTPAVWTMYQRFMFQPINQPFQTVNRNAQISTWADPDYPFYQYADADGDGMVDSRWFELTAARDTNSGNTTPRDDIERLYDAGRYRLFAAARVVDLTSMVNVNTASDQLEAPEPGQGRNAPLGITPGEVDLRRLLTMQDASTNYSIAPFVGLSPSYIHRPRHSTTTNPTDDDYWFYRAYIDDPSAMRKEIRPHAVPMSVGRFAYSAIKRGQYEGGILDERYYAWPPEVERGGNNIQYTDMDFDDKFNPPDANFLDPTDASAVDYRLDQGPAYTNMAVGRKELYFNYGRLDPFSAKDAGLNQPVRGLYNEDDLFELLAFHGLNDPNTVSRLEKAAMGRTPSMFDQNQRSFSPLFSNRPLALDRLRHGYVDRNGYNGHYVIHDLLPNFERDINGSIAKETMAFMALSPRKLLTTVSGGAGIVSGDVILPSEIELQDSEAAPTLRSAMGDVKTLFGIYSNALAGELNASKLNIAMDDLFVEDLDTTRTDTDAAPAATLFYGHKGPELALRIAAHAAVNMKDLTDSDSDPTIVTLLMDNSKRDELDTNFPNPLDPDDEWYRDYPGVAEGNLLLPDVLPGTAPSTAHLPEHRQAVNIYGIEAMPVITEVATFYVYHDASEDAGGDMDYGPQRAVRTTQNPPAVPFPGTQNKITIQSGTNPAANPDCMMQGIAFQLHNPFATEISLGGSGIANRQALTRKRDPNDTSQVDTDPDANFQFDYYIEWNGYFFKLAQYLQYYPPRMNIYNMRLLDNDDLGVPNPAINPPPGAGPDDGFSLETNQTNPMFQDYIARNVVLQPGETRVFYAFANPEFDDSNNEMFLDTKWKSAMIASGGLRSRFTDLALFDVDNDSLADGYDFQGWTGPAQEWVQNQFLGTAEGSGTLPVMVHPMDPRTGKYLDESVREYLVTAGNVVNAPNRSDSTEVRLWRKITTPAEETTDTTGNLVNSVPENLLHNDMLVDRLKLESGIAEPIITEPGTNEVPKTASFAEDYPSTTAERAAEVRNDNTGFTVVKWAVTSRRDRDETDVLPSGYGQVREWMLSSRLNPVAGLVFGSDEIMTIDGNALLSAGDFIDSDKDLDNVTEPAGTISDGIASIRTDRETYAEFENLFMVEHDPDSVLVTMGMIPELKNLLDDSDGNGDGSETKFGRDASQWNHPMSITLHEFDDTSPTNLRPELFLSGEGILQAPRLADLLLPWGIGPTYTPTASGSLNENSNDPGYYSEEWMTWTEALAIALGYDNPAAGDTSTTAADDVWHNAFTADERLFDNGHLRIDDYVAYYNDPSQDSDPDYPEFDVNVDLHRGTGIPLALGVLDQVRAIDPLQNSFTPEELLQIPTFGQININTAPVEVLRLLPGLSPSLGKYYPDNNIAATETEWWANQDSDWMLPNLTEASAPGGSKLNGTPDVAAMLVAYRDRIQAPARYATIGGPAVNVRESDPLRYSTDPNASPNSSPNANSDHTRNLITELDGEDRGKTTDSRDRATISGTNGLRSTPGFSSVGEVLMATIKPGIYGAQIVSGPTFTLDSLYSQLDIQQYGTDALNLDGDILNKIAMDPQVFGGDEHGLTKDDYAERLAMANGILNTITVRSDYFAVWFVIHAYQESDVANLKPEDPLVPSIAKRYVMVVDRTNVINPGDTPKVVFLKEVPM